MDTKELENSAKKVKRELDKLNKASYGMTFDELIKTISGRNDGDIKNPMENKSSKSSEPGK